MLTMTATYAAVAAVSVAAAGFFASLAYLFAGAVAEGGLE